MERVCKRAKSSCEQVEICKLQRAACAQTDNSNSTMSNSEGVSMV